MKEYSKYNELFYELVQYKKNYESYIMFMPELIVL